MFLPPSDIVAEVRKADGEGIHTAEISVGRIVYCTALDDFTLAFSGILPEFDRASAEVHVPMLRLPSYLEVWNHALIAGTAVVRRAIVDPVLVASPDSRCKFLGDIRPNYGHKYQLRDKY
ncbi:hypothetical protein [Breoghania sp.]|uniref:hypothetical protein n=1 Tax=Breoghania sp. TaxID=2065378 RepID=UPI002627D70A|nr:hypothetical protein [Breoghania sp.]MDJ0933212.1 hypothetical protein [Breoghania sp.]